MNGTRSPTAEPRETELREDRHSVVSGLGMIAEICRGEPADLQRRLDGGIRSALLYVTVILVGSGAYGVTIGLWRAPLQGLFAAVKFPLLILLTTAANSLLNGMLAQLMGLRISFRESVLAIGASFAVAACILGSLSPVTLFILLNTPPLGAGDAVLSHSFTLVAHVLIIAFAGVTANVSLMRFLVHLSRDRRTARRILCAWLAGNMFLGAQLSWNMRPFIGSPGLPVQFFRPDAFHGNFYESVGRALLNLVS